MRRGVTANQGEIFVDKPAQQVVVYLARDAHIPADGGNSCVLYFVLVTSLRSRLFFAVELYNAASLNLTRACAVT